LAGTAKNCKPVENRTDRLLDPAIWVDFDLPAGRPTVAGWQVALELPTAGLLPQRLKRPLPEQMKFKLIHCAF
jgi:hypothetical protein